MLQGATIAVAEAIGAATVPVGTATKAVAEAVGVATVPVGRAAAVSGGAKVRKRHWRGPPAWQLLAEDVRGGCDGIRK